MNLDKKDERQLLKMLSSGISENSHEFEIIFKKDTNKEIDKSTFII